MPDLPTDAPRRASAASHDEVWNAAIEAAKAKVGERRNLLLMQGLRAKAQELNRMIGVLHALRREPTDAQS